MFFFNHPTFGVHNFGPFPMCAWVTAFEIVNGQQQFHSTRVPDKKLSRIRRNDPTHEHVQETGDQNQHMFTRWQCSTTLKNMFPDYQHCLGRPRKPPTVGLAHHFHPFPPSKFWSTSKIFPTFFPTEISSRKSPTEISPPPVEVSAASASSAAARSRSWRRVSSVAARRAARSWASAASA